MQKVLTIFANTIFIISLLFSGFLFLSKIQKFPLPKIFLVSSGSMEPAIKTGSLVFTNPQNQYSTGDIVTFKTDSKSKITTTHRVVAIDNNIVKTAGDANNAPDTKLVSVNDIVGKVYTIIPYLGYLAGFIQTPQGFILFVIVPATILIYEELKSLFFEIKNKIKKSKLPSPVLRRGIEGEVKKIAWLAIIPVLFAGLVITTKSNSYFSDIESSTQNSFTAWVPADTPPPPAPTPHPVINEFAPTATGNNEWIEIYNPSSSELNLTGWRIRDNAASKEDIIPTVNPIPANGYGVIMASDGNPALIPISAIPIILSDSTVGNGLNNGGDMILLKAPDGTVIDQVSFDQDTSVFDIPISGTLSNTSSLSRSPNGIDTNTALDWIIDVSPSIGVVN